MSSSIEYTLSQFPEPPPLNKTSKLATQGARIPSPPNYPPPPPPTCRPTPRRHLSPAVSQEHITYHPYATTPPPPPETVATITSDANSANSATSTTSRGTTPLPPASDTSNFSVPLNHPASNTMEMLQTLSANQTPPPEVLAHFRDILRSTLHRALLYTVPPTAGIHQDRIEALAELYSVMAGLGTSLTFLFALSENIRAKEVESMEKKKRQMKELDRCRIITQKNIVDVLACLP